MRVEIRLCRPSDAAEPKTTSITNLINEVYADAELGMWQSGFKRVQKEEVINYIKNQNLIFAEKEGNIVGSIFVVKRSDELGEFGMLVCDPLERHQGIGQELIAAAENKCRSEGCTTMQLELLYPRTWRQKTKEILKLWYPSLGYIKGSEENFNNYYPQLAPLLITDCLFSIYTKNL